MYRILITDDISPQALEHLEEAGDVEFEIVKSPPQEELVRIVGGYDALIIRSSVKVDTDVINAGERLRVIGRAGVGLDNVDVESASMRGVIVMNTPDANTTATAEHTLAMMMSLCRNLPQAHASMKKGEWSRKKFTGVQLNKKTLGVVGLGRVGRKVAQRASAFGMQVIAHDPYVGEKLAQEANVLLVSMEELLSRSDFITLHSALTDESHYMIGREQIAMMKKGVRLVNCARGGLVDTDALVEGLRSGQIAGAALDVYEQEPLPADSPLPEMDNVILTPHIAASTIEAQRDVGIHIIDQVLDALHEKEYRNAVNMPIPDAAVFKNLYPYLNLAEKVGSMQTQMSDGPIQRVEVEFQGDDIRDYGRALSIAVLKGLLTPMMGENLNYVNAPHLARKRGIKLSQTHGLDVVDYPNLISCHALWDGGGRTISATLFGKNEPRIVKIDNFRMDMLPQGIILVVEVANVPGVAGEFGTILGRHNINILEWRLGRGGPEERVLGLLSLGTDIPQEAIDEIRAVDALFDARRVRL